VTVAYVVLAIHSLYGTAAYPLQWPKYETASDIVLVLDVPSQNEYGGSGIHTTTGLRKAACDYNEDNQGSGSDISLSKRE
jgi:hypothetical protein